MNTSSIPRRPKQEQLSKFEDGCLAFLLSIFSWPIIALAEAFVLVRLWTWFVVPTFHAPRLTMVPAIGIAYVAAFLTHEDRIDPNDDRSATEKVCSHVLNMLMRAALFLAFGAIVAVFM